MKKLRLSRVLYTCCNVSLILLSVCSITYSIISLIISRSEVKTIFNTVNKDYEACFGKKYVHEESYFTDITCMKMEIASDIINKSANLKNQYIDKINDELGIEETNGSSELNINESESFTNLLDSLSNIQSYNKPIQYKESSLPLLSNSSSLYTSLNYMTYGSDALLIDIANFIIDQEALTLTTDKDVQEIRVMANMSTNIVLNLNKQIYFYKFSILVSLIFLLGTCVNIYRIRTYKYRGKRKHIIKI